MFSYIRKVVIGVVITLAQIASANALRAQVAGELRGRVSNLQTSAGLPNARVEIDGVAEEVRTNGDGAFVMRGLPPRAYNVRVGAIGFHSREYEIVMANGRTTTLNAELVPVAATLSAVLVQAERHAASDGATVFDRAAIERSGMHDVGELLQGLNGVIITRAGGPGQATTASVRGSSSAQVLVVVDGIPANSPVTGIADLSQFSLETVNAVTVRTGAQSAQFGARAMAGVIEIKTRKPERELSAQLRAGSLSARNASLSVGQSRSVGEVVAGASVTANHEHTGGTFEYSLPVFRGGGRAIRINSDATADELLGTLSLGGAEKKALIRGNWRETERGLAGTIIQPSATGRQRDTRTGANASVNGHARSIGWVVNANVTRERTSYVDTAPPFSSAYRDTIKATAATAAASATFDRPTYLLSSGVELRTLGVQSTMLSGAAPGRQWLTAQWGNARAMRSIGATNFRFVADVGARFDQAQAFHATANAVGNASQNAFSPRASISVAREAISLALSAGSGFSPPTLADQFFHEGVQVRANPLLRAERTRRDVEARLAFREHAVRAIAVGGEFAAYRSDIDGMILWFPDFQYVWSPVNYDVHRSGWETNATLKVPAARGELSGGLNHNDVAYAGGVLTGQVTYRPRSSAHVEFAWAPSFMRLSGFSRYVGSRRTVAGAAINSLAPYWVTDAGLSRSFAAHNWSLQAGARVENVFNSDASMLVDYPFPPRTWSISLRVRRSYSPQP